MNHDPQMNHDPHPHHDWDEHAAAYALHALEPADELAFLAHLSHCRRCADALAEHRRVAAALADVVGAEPPPADLWTGIRAGIAPGAPPGPVRPDPPSPARPARRAPRAAPPRQPSGRCWWRHWRALAAAATLIAIVVGVGGWQAADRLGGSPSSVQALAGACRADPGCHLVELTGRRPGGSALLLVRAGHVRLVDTGLDRLPADQTYVLWQLPRDGAPTGLAAFTVPGHRTALAEVPLRRPLSETTAFAVSREPGHRIPSAPSTVIAFGAARA